MSLLTPPRTNRADVPRPRTGGDPRRPRRSAVRALTLAGVVVLAAIGYQTLDHPSPLLSAGSAVPPRSSSSGLSGAPPATDARPGPVPPPGDDPASNDGLGVDDGVVPDGVTVFDDHLPGVVNLDGSFLAALRRAGSAAADDGVELDVNSGWRSRAYQEDLLQQAIARYGSREAAARWVSTPDTSLHVSGDAIDIGGTGAASWLSRHGAAYGLCRIYDNEPWHFELRPDAVDQGCPHRYADPTEDPRTQG